jgi:hypothetical protein
MRCTSIRAVSLAAALCLIGGLAEGQSIPRVRACDRSALADQVFSDGKIYLVQIPLDRPIPVYWRDKSYNPDGWGFPPDLIRRARLRAVSLQVLKGSEITDRSLDLTSSFEVFEANSRCWWLGHAKGALKLIVFLRPGARGAVLQPCGPEWDLGVYSDLNPDFDRIVAAIERAAGWRDERMQAVAADMLWPDQRAALEDGGNRYAGHLAARFLQDHGAADVVDRLWGPPESPARRAREIEMRRLMGRDCCGQ